MTEFVIPKPTPDEICIWKQLEPKWTNFFKATCNDGAKEFMKKDITGIICPYCARLIRLDYIK